MVRQKVFLPEHILNKIDSFLKPDVLIAQIQTCCEGLNLQHFAEVYFTTPHWNPAVEDQAVARAHRIGQTQTVTVIRLVAEDSIETQILQLQEEKRKIASDLLSDSVSKLSLEEITQLLE